VGGIFNQETVMSEHGQFAIYKWSVRDLKGNEEGSGGGSIRYCQYNTTYHSISQHNTS
jgi:hypothetical protein